ncbi:hypothetical protein [Leptonema illini]|jgi:hypothetical protein|uniref:Uncharacterized protein n=1 Tax=Leptonema illini DSM 21528 TaxID=929563 RepID=H2CCS9_9LEPT|nr:hypothetical protein [Leptonema illini]EHQ05370.1 hypothetical protein Lepil_0667 [Leptonema illini DSM 21528]
MIRIFFLLSLVSGALFYRYPAVGYDAPPDISVQCSDFFSSADYQTLRDEDGPVFYDRGKRVPLDPDRLYFVPPEGNGYFEYQKIGKEIAYYAHPDELYWKRESASYPVSDPRGKWILLLSGDLTAVRLMDHNGNAAPGLPLSGVLMTDYAFSDAEHSDESKNSAQTAGSTAAVLFSSGPVYIVRFEPDFRIFTLTIPGAERSFAKSVAVGGDRIAIHLQQDDQDFIREYRLDEEKERLKEIESVRLPLVVPHRMPMALTESGVLFATGRFAGQIEDGEISWTGNGDGTTAFHADTPGADISGVEFQGDALATGGFAIAGGERFLYLLVKNDDQEEKPVAATLRPSSPYRLLRHKGGISIEDSNGYCTIRPSASRK